MGAIIKKMVINIQTKLVIQCFLSKRSIVSPLSCVSNLIPEGLYIKEERKWLEKEKGASPVLSAGGEGLLAVGEIKISGIILS